MSKVICYTDASLSQEHKIAACAYCILYRNKLVKHEVLIIEASNINDAEAHAIEFALKAAFSLKYTSKIEVFTDSESNVIIPRRRKEYHKRLFNTITTIQASSVEVNLTHVKAHTGIQYNLLADTSARKQIRKYIKSNFENNKTGFKKIDRYG